MAVQHKLSSKEVAALVGGLMSMDSDDAGGGSEEQEYRAYEFGKNDNALLGDFHGLRMINERFCRVARSVFMPMLRVQPRISAFPPELKTFSDYCDELENFVSMTTSRMEELRANQMTVIPPSFVSQLTDSYYGGSLSHMPARRREFTATEHRVIEIVTDGLNRALELAWRDLAPLSFRVTNHEENLQFATFVDNEELIVNCSFMIQLPDAEPANLDIIYPLQSLKPIAPQLRSRMQSDVVDSDMSWRQKLENAILNVPLTINARLCESEVRMRSLNNVHAGKVVPVNIRPDLHLLIEGQRMFSAELGEVGGRSAVNLTVKEFE